MDFYGNFNPYAMQQNPYGMNTNMYQQYGQSQRTQTQQQNTPIVKYVSSVNDFNSVTLQPNMQAILIAQNEPYMCFKTADSMGMLSNSTYYKIEQVTQEQLTAPAMEYATKQEVARLENAVNQIINALNGGIKNEPVNASNTATEQQFNAVNTDATTGKPGANSSANASK